MDHQPKVKAQSASALYLDRRGMRAPVEHTVARGELRLDAHYYQGIDGRIENGKFAERFPARLSIDAALMARGRERYGIFCTPCHGPDGRGTGYNPWCVARAVGDVSNSFPRNCWQLGTLTS